MKKHQSQKKKYSYFVFSFSPTTMTATTTIQRCIQMVAALTRSPAPAVRPLSGGGFGGQATARPRKRVPSSARLKHEPHASCMTPPPGVPVSTTPHPQPPRPATAMASVSSGTSRKTFRNFALLAAKPEVEQNMPDARVAMTCNALQGESREARRMINSAVLRVKDILTELQEAELESKQADWKTNNSYVLNDAAPPVAPCVADRLRTVDANVDAVMQMQAQAPISPAFNLSDVQVTTEDTIDVEQLLNQPNPFVPLGNEMLTLGEMSGDDGEMPPTPEVAPMNKVDGALKPEGFVTRSPVSPVGSKSGTKEKFCGLKLGAFAVDTGAKHEGTTEQKLFALVNKTTSHMEVLHRYCRILVSRGMLQGDHEMISETEHALEGIHQIRDIVNDVVSDAEATGEDLQRHKHKLLVLAERDKSIDVAMNIHRLNALQLKTIVRWQKHVMWRQRIARNKDVPASHEAVSKPTVNKSNAFTSAILFIALEFGAEHARSNCATMDTFNSLVVAASRFANATIAVQGEGCCANEGYYCLLFQNEPEAVAFAIQLQYAMMRVKWPADLLSPEGLGSIASSADVDPLSTLTKEVEFYKTHVAGKAAYPACDVNKFTHIAETLCGGEADSKEEAGVALAGILPHHSVF